MSRDEIDESHDRKRSMEQIQQGLKKTFVQIKIQQSTQHRSHKYTMFFVTRMFLPKTETEEKYKFT